MRTRQQRFQTGAQIQSHLAELQGKKINIVTAKNEVIFGTLVKYTDASVTIQNMRLKPQTLLLKNIYEILIDTYA